MNRHPMFCDMQNMMESMMFGKEPENLLDDGSCDPGIHGNGCEGAVCHGTAGQ